METLVGAHRAVGCSFGALQCWMSWLCISVGHVKDKNH